MKLEKNIKLLISDAAKTIGVSTATLRRWEDKRLLVPKRDKLSGYRIYAYADLVKGQKMSQKGHLSIG